MELSFGCVDLGRSQVDAFVRRLGDGTAGAAAGPSSGNHPSGGAVDCDGADWVSPCFCPPGFEGPHHTADGDEVVMSLLCRRCLVRWRSGWRRSLADVVALRLHLVKLRSAPFSALLQREAGFALALARLEASRLRDLNQRFALQSADATTRLLDALAYLARKTGPEAEPTAVIPPLAQKEIALIGGLARETASRTSANCELDQRSELPTMAPCSWPTCSLSLSAVCYLSPEDKWSAAGCSPDDRADVVIRRCGVGRC